MTIGANSDRVELVKTLREMQFSDLNLGFLSGQDIGGKQRPGYDRFGKYSLRLGAGMVWFACSGFAVLMFQSFFPRSTSNYDDPLYAWMRGNLMWTAPIWAVTIFFLMKKGKKEGTKESAFLASSVAENGLVVLPGGTNFPGDLVTPLNSLLLNEYTLRGTTFESAFALKYESQIRVAFGLSSLWWDASSRVSTNRGLNPSQSLFVYVALPELTNDFVYMNPNTPPVWDQLPAMTDRARTSLTLLASKYAVVIGGGGIGVGLAKDSMNALTTTMRGVMTSPSGWQACYGLLSGEVADLVEGLL
jgi:hypothetical protein